MQNLPRRAIVGSVLFILGVLACSSRDTPEERTATNKEHLTQSELGRVLNFEGTLGSTGDWIASSGTVASSTAHASAGTHSMVTSGAYSVSVTSTALSALGSVGTKMSLDIWLPSALAGQSNKGNIQAYFTSNTLQLSVYATSNVQLTSLTPGQFSRIDIPLDSTLTTKLSQSGYADLTIKLAFNLADITHQTFVDNMVFSPGIAGTGGSSGTGGTNAVGGAGGTRALGGGTSTTINSGGTSNGGTPSLGGTNNMGGVSTFLANGGAPVTGGVPGNGGTLGVAGGIGYAGGTIATGGLSSAVASSLTGGAPASGGAASGGASVGATGGSAGAGGTGGSLDLPWGSGPYTFSFKLPPGVNRNRILLCTTGGDLWVNDGVKLMDAAYHATITSVDGGKVNRIGVAAETSNVWSGGDTTLANNAIVYGSVITSGLLIEQAGAGVTGAVSEQANIAPLQTISWTVTFPAISLPEVSLTGSQLLSPGGYAAYGVKSGAQLGLGRGTYYFNSLMLEPGSVLNIDNSQGPVFVYVMQGYTQRGAVVTATNQANVLIGVAGTSAIPIESSLNSILVAPAASVSLATLTSGHSGAVFAKSITAHQNTTIRLNALDSSNFCEPTAACSSFCPCSAGSACANDSSCGFGLVCGSGNGAKFGLDAATNVCWGANCSVSSVGSECSRSPQKCSADAECGSGQVCGVNNGSAFQYMSSRLCWNPSCTTDPVGTGCGTLQSPCGLCPSTCVPNCTAKKCGDSSDDGCGGTCTGYCKNGDVGCTASIQCKTGSVCSAEAWTYFNKSPGATVCWPVQCETQSAPQRDCGKSASVCGPSCPSASGQCANRQCGADLTTGASCGSCASGQFCNGGGQCQVLSTDIIGSPPPIGTPTTPPVSATDVGAIPGTLSVSQQGKAHYNVALFVPPGVNGLAPRLGLEYDSSLHQGEVGTGWTISGLSTIERCGPAAVSYTDADHYCLDGAPLVRVSQTYGEGAEFRLQLDPTVRVIVHTSGTGASYSGPDHFDVFSPDGRMSQYGGDQQSRGSLAEPNGSAGVYNIWALSSVSDPLGNKIQYLYTSDTLTTFGGDYPADLPGIPISTRMIRGTRPILATIAYGGSASISGNRSISFERENHPQSSLSRYGWKSGFPYRQFQRIKSISMLYEDQEIRKYVLQYAADTRRNKLSSIFECSQGHCKQPTVFTYKVPSQLKLPLKHLEGDISTLLGGYAIKAIAAVLDVDGDGRTDLILDPNYDPSSPINCAGAMKLAHNVGDGPARIRFEIYSLPEGFNSCDSLSTGDLDGDGKDELFLRKGALTEGINNDPGDGYFSVAWNASTHQWSSPKLITTSTTLPHLADYDGDGRFELQQKGSLLDLDTDDDGVPNPIGSLTLLANNIVLGVPSNHSDLTLIADLNIGIPVPPFSKLATDQDQFIRRHQSDNVTCTIDVCDDKNESCQAQLDAQQFCWDQRDFRLADWSTGTKILDANGDGLKDLLIWRLGSSVDGSQMASPSELLELWINTGRNQFTLAPVGMPQLFSEADSAVLNSILNAGSFKQSFVFDVDQDGLQDLVLFDTFTKNAYALMFQPGPGYGALAHLQLLNGNGQATYFVDWFKDEGRVLVMDFDGDGVADTLYGDGAKLQLEFQGGADHDLLDTVTDGNGKVDSIAYVSGRASGYYTTTPVHPQIGSESKPALYMSPIVISHQQTTAGGAPAVTESFTYVDGRVGYYGRGFLGFTEVDKTVSTSDLGTVVDEKTYYHPDINDNQLVQYPFPERLGSNLYYEAGRPWKQVVTNYGVRSGFGDAAKTVDHVSTRTRTLTRRQSDTVNNVLLVVPDIDTNVESEIDAEGNEQILSDGAASYSFDKYGQRVMVQHFVRGPDGSLQESQKTTITYERGEGFIGQWLLNLPNSISTIEFVGSDSVSHLDNMEYYPNGKLHFIHKEPNDVNLASNTEYRYNDRGNVAAIIESDAIITRETDNYYDSAGDLVQSSMNPLLQATGFAYFRGYGQVAVVQDANGLRTSRQIDSFGREIQTTDVNGINTTRSFEPPGTEARFLTSKGRDVVSAVRVVKSGEPTAITYFDHFGRNIGATTTDADGISLHSQAYFDSLGRKISRSHKPFADVRAAEHLDYITYDNLSRATSVAVANDNASGNLARYTIEYGLPSGFASPIPSDRQTASVAVTRVTYPNASVVSTLLDAHGRKVAMTDRTGSTTTYKYGAVGRLLSFTDAAGQTTSYKYDGYGRQTYAYDAVRGPTQTFFMTPSGNYKIVLCPTGEIDTQLDKLGRLEYESTPEGTTTWTYDSEPGAIGRLVEVRGPGTENAVNGHAVHYTYGDANAPAGYRGAVTKVTSTIGNESFDFDYEYDSSGRVQTVVYPAIAGQRYAVTEGYSPGGRLSKVTEASSSGRTLWEATNRDVLGRVISEQALGTMATSHGYTEIEGLLSQSTTTEGAQEPLRLNYTYDMEHNVTGIEWHENGLSSTRSRMYTYDPSGRITDEWTAVNMGSGLIPRNPIDHITYASNGNIDSRSAVGQYTYGQFGNPYAVTSAGDNTYEYDPIGRQRSRSGPTVPGGQMQVAWTSFDSPKSVTFSDGSSTQFEYNGLKERVLEVSPTQRKLRVGGLYQRVDNLTTGDRTHSLSVMAGSMTIAEVVLTESAGAVSGPSVSAIVSDKLGSATLVRDPSGQYTTRNYDAFGKASGPAVTPSGLAFAGYNQDDAIGLLWMNNRLYDPNIGRVLAADPVIADRMGQDGANRYSYVYNHPTAFIDPSGFEGESGGEDEGGDGGPDLQWVPSVDFGSLSNPFGPVQVSFGLVDMSSDTSSPMTGEESSTYRGGEEHAGPSSGGVGADPVNGDGFSSDSSLGSAKFDLTAVRYAQDPASSEGEKARPSATGIGWLGLMLMAVLNPPAAIVAGASAAIAEGAVVVEENLPAIENAEAAIAEAGAAELSQLSAEASEFGSQLSRLGSFVSENGTALARWLGVQGESAVRAVYDIGTKEPIAVDGRVRIPDGLTSDMLSEVKNVAYQPFTLQLRDFVNYAQQNQLQFNLYVRPDTTLSGPLLDAYQNGVLNILTIPFGK